MKTPILRLLAALFLAAFAAACDSPTGGSTGTPKPAQEDARVGFSVNLSGLSTNTLVVHVTAPDITTPLVFNVPVINGTATGNIAIPPGLSRTITVRAYDAQGILTHEGSAVVQQVRPGQNMNVVITLIPKAGHVPITINMGSLVVSVSRVRPAPTGGDLVGDTVRFTAQVTFPDGRPVPGAVVRWASANPSIGSVDATGLVTGLIPGSTEIVATYEGFGASHPVTFVLAAADQTAPTLVSVNATPDSIEMGTTPSTASVSFAVTADDAGRGFSSMSVVLQSPDGSTYQCSASGAPAPGRATRTCAVTLPRTGPGGRWTVRELTVADSAGNSRSYTGAELAATGFDSGVTMTGTAPDTQAPVLLRAEFGESYVHLPGMAASLLMIIVATDDGSGIDWIEVTGSHEQAGVLTYSERAGVVWWMPSDPPTWGVGVLMDSSMPSGWVYLDTVRMRDRAGNEVHLDAAELTRRGMRTRFYLDTTWNGAPPPGMPMP